jgi:molecular chaperone Hsp33
MGKEELDSILRERDNIEVVCEFCGQHYQFDKVDVEVLLQEENPPNNLEIVH